jgi:4-aminobutyrate aminotransferase-like enzyme
VERGEGCYLYNADGRQYLDCVNNVAHVGHGNTQVGQCVWARGGGGLSQ